MKKILFIILFFPSLVFAQATGKMLSNRTVNGTLPVDTINANSKINLNQTTAGITLIVPKRTTLLTSGTSLYIHNIGTVPITLTPGGIIDTATGIFFDWVGNNWNAVGKGPTSAGSGTVLTVSVVPANGISGSVANPTTTPAITLSLGAITPTTVNGVTLSGSSTPTLAVTGTSTISGTHSGSSSGTNTGDQTNITGNSGTATALQTARTINGTSFDGTSNITITSAPSGSAGGDLSGTYPNPTVTKINGTSLGGLSTGILKNTTTTGVPSIAVAADFPTLNQNTTGSSAYCTGNAATATALQTARTINGTSFDGTANITVTAAAGTLTGTTLNSSVVTSSLTSVGTLANLTVTNPISGSITGNAGTVTTNANLTGPITSSGNATSVASQTGTGTKFVMDNTPTLITPLLGTPTSGVLTNCTGTASGLTAGTATALQNARTINGTSFDGTANITVTAAAGTLTGTTLNSSVVNSSLTSVGTLANLTVTNPITGSITGNAATVTTNANLTGDVTSSGNATTYNNVVPSSKGGAGSVTGLLKANGSGTVSAAVAGTDYQAALTNPITGTGTSGQVSYWNGTNTQTGDANFSYSNISSVPMLQIGPTTPTATLHLSQQASTSPISISTLTQPAHTGGSARIQTLTGGALTGITSATEMRDVSWNLARTVTWDTNLPTTQRFCLIAGPTIDCSAISTGTDAYNVFISPPTTTGNATYTNKYAAGFGGNLGFTASSILTTANNSSTIGIGTNNITRSMWTATGVQTHTQDVSSSGTNTFVLFTQADHTGGIKRGFKWIGGALTNQTTASEITDVTFDLSAVLKIADGTVGTNRSFIVQGRTITPQTTALTITNPITMEVGPPIAGTGTTFTNPAIAIKSTGKISTVDLTCTNSIVGSITGNAATVTTNANLTGPITSSGNATSIASQTGTGTKFVMDNTPTLITPNIGVATATSINGITLTGSSTPALTVTGTTSVSGANTGDQTTITGNAGTATTLQTGRTIGITGDLTYTSPSFNGSANVTAAGTLATVNSNVGSFGSATQTGTFTVNGKGLITAASNTTITPAIGSVTGLGTGIATALAVNTGSAGAPILFNGAAGTPTSLTGTNITGTAAGLTAGTVTTNANLTGDITSSGNATTYNNVVPTAKAGTPTAGTTGQVLTKNSNTNYDYSWTTIGGTGTVTDMSVVSANGFAGTVATSTSTPAVTISTTVTGVLKGNGTSMSAATAGTDYAVPATISSDATDADYTAVVNSVKYLPAATLTANRTITIPTGSNGDFLELYNNETGFSWNLTGAAIYLADGTTTITSLYANTNHLIRKVSGKWRVLN